MQLKVTSIIAQAWFQLVQSRELALAIAEDSKFENILNDFANIKARKVFFCKSIMNCLICLS